MTTSAQVLGANGVLLPNAQANTTQASTTGALPAQPTANPGEVIATSGGSAITGATGKDLPTCMAWDKSTHIAKPRWREICARTLTEPHL